MATTDPENETKERMTLMQLQELEKGDVSWLATLRIGELDKLVSGIKQRQAHCLKDALQYENEIGFIDNEIQRIMERYNPLCKQLSERKLERDQLQKLCDESIDQVGTLLASTKKQLRRSNYQETQNLRKEARTVLSATRGYSVGPESRMYMARQKK